MSRSRLAALIAAVSVVSLAAAAHGAGKLVFSEICYDEVGSTFDGEWFEIYNGSDLVIDLSNYKIGDEETKGATSVSEAMFQFPLGASIAPGEVQLVASFASRFKTVYGFAPTYEAGSTRPEDNWADDLEVPNMSIYAAWDPDGAYLNMSNTNDQALILDADDNIVDAVNWGNTFFFNPGVNPTQTSGQSIQRIDANIDTDTAADWQLTPAAPAGSFWTSRSTPGTLPIVAAPFNWSADADGVWIVGVNWENGIAPNGPGQTAVFGGAITAPRVVTLLDDQTLGTLRFDSEFTYTLESPGTLKLDTLAGLPAVQVARGSHVIAAAVTLHKNTTFEVAADASLVVSGDVASSTVAITKAGAGTLTLNRVVATGLNVNGGRLAIAAGGTDASTSVVGALTIAEGAAFDLNDNALVIDYASDAPAGPLADIGAAIRDGRLTSGLLADTRYGIATADTATFVLATFAGIDLDATAVVARVALKGDANIDGFVDFDDLLALAQNYGGQGAWTTGDTNYDGLVNFDDLLALAQNYGGGAAGVEVDGIGGSAFAADWALAVSMVPEPASLLGLAAAAGLWTRRRR